MKRETKKQTGRVLDIQRMSTEDGPGLRTTVFLKGCTLNCTWCHNPESIAPEFETQWLSESCIGCRTCVDICKEKALSFNDGIIEIDRTACNGCGSCTEACPSMAIEQIGTLWEVDDLVSELVKDRAYFENGDGGITLSGGELTMQSDFCRDVLKGLQAGNVKTAIDTCGQCSEKALLKLLPYTDLILFDLKEMDPERHKLFTGKSNGRILDNLKMVSDWCQKDRKRLWIRTPVIPGATMTDDNITAMGAFIAGIPDGVVERWELCTFNNLCRDKYARLGLDWKHGNAELIRRSEIEDFADTAGKSGVNPELIHWSGSLRSDD